MARPVSDDRKKQFMKLSKEALVRLLLDEIKKNENLKEELEKFSEAYKKYRDYEKEELAESCYDFARENQKLKESLNIATKCSSKEEDWIIRLSEENRKLKLHIEAKDKAYTALLKDYEELKDKNKNLKEKLEKQLWEMLFDVRS